MSNLVTSGTVGSLNINSNIWGGNSSDSVSGGYNYTTTTTTVPTIVIPTTKRCRDCNHAHLNSECVEFSDWGAVTFVKCDCQEYTPKDNLEYLEHLYDKKQRKESTPSL